jgi:hypothetical protein
MDADKMPIVHQAETKNKLEVSVKKTISKTKRQAEKFVSVAKAAKQKAPVKDTCIHRARPGECRISWCKNARKGEK